MSCAQQKSVLPSPAGTPDRHYEYWRNRILISTMIGYILFYFVRKSITLAMPLIDADPALKVTKVTLGIYLSTHGVLYGFSRFINGMWSDRVNPRYFMSIGLFLAALTNIGFGCSSLAWLMGTFWIINGWVQGMGFPPCAKSLTHWFAPEERGVKFSIWNISHSLGAGFVFLLNSIVVVLGWHWRFCFFVPAALAVSGSIFLFWALRDSPESMGMEPIEDYYDRKTGRKSTPPVTSAPQKEPFWDVLVKHVFTNWAIWVLCFANFFVYIVRFSILDWAPTFLTQHKGIELAHAGWMTAGYEIFGVIGTLLSGLLMDRVFRGRGTKVCALYMLFCSLIAFGFWYLSSNSIIVNALFLWMLGFCVYGPQCLIGCIAANLATKKAAASSSGLTGLFGYLSTIVTGWGVGELASQSNGWNLVFLMLVGSAFLAMILFTLILNAASPEIVQREKEEQMKKSA